MTHIPVTPVLPENFGATANAERSEQEIRQWWCLPYVVKAGSGWNVYCLDGGAWDRPTWHATKPTQEEAVQYAEELHRLYWSRPSSNELPLPFPYEMQYSNLNGSCALAATLVGPALEASELRAQQAT